MERRLFFSFIASFALHLIVFLFLVVGTGGESRSISRDGRFRALVVSVVDGMKVDAGAMGDARGEMPKRSEKGKSVPRLSAPLGKNSNAQPSDDRMASVAGPVTVNDTVFLGKRLDLLISGIADQLLRSAISSNGMEPPEWVPSAMEDFLADRRGNTPIVLDKNLSDVLLSSWEESGAPPLAVGSSAIFLVWVSNDGTVVHSQAVLENPKVQDEMVSRFAEKLFELRWGWKPGEIPKENVTVVAMMISMRKGVSGPSAKIEELKLDAVRPK